MSGGATPKTRSRRSGFFVKSGTIDLKRDEIRLNRHRALVFDGAWLYRQSRFTRMESIRAFCVWNLGWLECQCCGLVEPVGGYALIGSHKYKAGDDRYFCVGPAVLSYED